MVSLQSLTDDSSEDERWAKQKPYQRPIKVCRVGGLHFQTPENNLESLSPHNLWGGEKAADQEGKNCPGQRAGQCACKAPFRADNH